MKHNHLLVLCLQLPQKLSRRLVSGEKVGDNHGDAAAGHGFENAEQGLIDVRSATGFGCGEEMKNLFSMMTARVRRHGLTRRFTEKNEARSIMLADASSPSVVVVWIW